jgi:hypothetical protein
MDCQGGGTNGLASSGVSLSSMLPLRLSATDQDPKLLEWIKDWVELPNLQIISPEGWFTKAHSPGVIGCCRCDHWPVLRGAA